MKLIYSTLFIMLAWTAYGQKATNAYSQIEKDAIIAVNKQLEAYNNHDLDAFVSAFSADVSLFNYPNEHTLTGTLELSNSFKDFFNSSPNLHCEITNRMVLGNEIIDYELITGHSQDPEEELRVIAIYTVEKSLISEVRFIYR